MALKRINKELTDLGRYVINEDIARVLLRCIGGATRPSGLPIKTTTTTTQHRHHNTDTEYTESSLLTLLFVQVILPHHARPDLLARI